MGGLAIPAQPTSYRYGWPGAQKSSTTTLVDGQSLAQHAKWQRDSRGACAQPSMDELADSDIRSQTMRPTTLQGMKARRDLKCAGYGARAQAHDFGMVATDVELQPGSAGFHSSGESAINDLWGPRQAASAFNPNPQHYGF